MGCVQAEWISEADIDFDADILGFVVLAGMRPNHVCKFSPSSYHSSSASLTHFLSYLSDQHFDLPHYFISCSIKKPRNREPKHQLAGIAGMINKYIPPSLKYSLPSQHTRLLQTHRLLKPFNYPS